MNKTAKCAAAILAILVIATPVYFRQRALLIEGQRGPINPPPMARLTQESGDVSLDLDGQSSPPENSKVPAAARGVGGGRAGKDQREAMGAETTDPEHRVAGERSPDQEPGAEGKEESDVPESSTNGITAEAERDAQPAPLRNADGVSSTAAKPALVNTTAESVEILQDGSRVPMEYPLVSAIPEGLSDHRSLDDGAFVTLAGPDRALYMFSAFWDQRPPLPQPLIRILTVIGHNTTLAETTRSIFCYVYCISDNGEQGHLEVSRPVTINTNSPQRVVVIPHRVHTSVIVTCRPRACAGRLRRAALGHSADKQTAVGQWRAGRTVPVEVMAPRGKRVKLGTCANLVYNQLNPKLLVEWFELQRILGVGKVFMANDGIDSESWHVLRHYIDQGYLTVQRSNFIELKDTYKDIHVRSTLSVAHCMYSMAYTFDRLMVIDTDEIIVPRRERTLVELLDTFAREEQAGGSQPVINYRFMHNEFILQHEYGAVPDENYPAFSTYMRYRRRAEYPSNTNAHVKSIFKPMHCVAVRSHYCTAKLKDDSMVTTRFVPRDFGLDCHYRQAISHRFKINELFQEDIMIKYADQLMEKVKKTLDKLHMEY